MIENILRGKMHTPDLIEIGPGYIGILMQIRSTENNAYQRSQATEIVEPGNVGIWNQVLKTGVWVVDKNSFNVVIMKNNIDITRTISINREDGSKFIIGLLAKFYLNNIAAANLIKNISYASVHEYSKNNKIMPSDNIFEIGLTDLYTREINSTKITKHDLKIETSPERSVGLLRKYIADITARIEERIKINGIHASIAIKSVEATIIV